MSGKVSESGIEEVSGNVSGSVSESGSEVVI